MIELNYLSISAAVILVAFICANLPTSLTIGHIKPTMAHLKKARLVKIDKERSVDRTKTISVSSHIFSSSREAEHLSKLKGLLEKAGIRLVVVTHQLKGVDAFRPYFDGDIYLDTQLFMFIIYREVNIINKNKKLLRTFFGPHERWMPVWMGLMRVKLWWYTLSSMREGLWGDLKGEGRLLGGVFLIAHDSLVWSYLEKEWGDKPNVQEIKAVVEKYARKTETSGSFYRICMVGGMVDIVAILNQHLLSVMPAHGIFVDFMMTSIVIGQANIAIAWGVRYAQGMTAIVLAMNRLTAVVFPVKFKQIWSNRNIFIVNSVQVVPGIVMGAGTFTGKFAYKKSDLGGIYCFINEGGSRSFYYTLAGFVQTLFIFYLIINYFVLFRSFRRQLKQARSDAVSRAKKHQENRLLIIAVVICSLEISTWLFSLWAFVIWVKSRAAGAERDARKDCRAFNFQIPSRLFHLIFDALYDVYACTPPYLLIGFSTPFQKRILAFFGLQRLPKTQPSSSTAMSIGTSTNSTSTRGRQLSYGDNLRTQ
ncbi:hypothetical protein PRIPAC_94877 [Pristionchus pacificus]|uniref:G protein-coupled receptor n=1 Tax=Pristionchus pacificus TaxID=54126 RepID=A0A2A6BPB0_PRIPA|nr:hypothetical protein PRIPAC_94877 [Pristionchus pacificus]|eukprot:PDM67747.1 G protein-coupled receptor [Pristionchus pacificus]